MKTSSLINRNNEKSYIVQAENGSIHRRYNRRHLLQTQEKPLNMTMLNKKSTTLRV